MARYRTVVLVRHMNAVLDSCSSYFDSPVPLRVVLRPPAVVVESGAPTVALAAQFVVEPDVPTVASVAQFVVASELAAVSLGFVMVCLAGHMLER